MIIDFDLICNKSPISIGFYRFLSITIDYLEKYCTAFCAVSAILDFISTPERHWKRGWKTSMNNISVNKMSCVCVCRRERPLKFGLIEFTQGTIQLCLETIFFNILVMIYSVYWVYSTDSTILRFPCDIPRLAYVGGRIFRSNHVLQVRSLSVTFSYVCFVLSSSFHCSI